jgi:hypothetical protein
MLVEIVLSQAVTCRPASSEILPDVCRRVEQVHEAHLRHLESFQIQRVTLPFPPHLMAPIAAAMDLNSAVVVAHTNLRRRQTAMIAASAGCVSVPLPLLA